MDADDSPRGVESAASTLTRRRLLYWLGGVGAVAVAGVAGLEMVDHGVLPGKQILDQLDGACSLPAPRLSFAPVGPVRSGRFFSAARRRSVGYTIAYPPGHGPGERLPLVVMLHGFGDDHRNALKGMTPAQALALRRSTGELKPMSLVTVDGGDGYWNPHPGDDPLSMVVDELIPMCQGLGLGLGPNAIALMGISMGGYGALSLAERHPGLVAAVAAISPAVWTSYAQAHAASAGAFASASAFSQGDVIAHAKSLRGTAVRVASGRDDPFLPGVEALITVLPKGSVSVIGSGCHSDPFFFEQEPPSLEFLSRRLA